MSLIHGETISLDASGMKFCPKLTSFHFQFHCTSHRMLYLFRFNYRSTHYMAMNGYYNFLNWFDDRAWYPLGRIVGGTVSHVYDHDYTNVNTC